MRAASKSTGSEICSCLRSPAVSYWNVHKNISWFSSMCGMDVVTLLSNYFLYRKFQAYVFCLKLCVSPCSIWNQNWVKLANQSVRGSRQRTLVRPQQYPSITRWWFQILFESFTLGKMMSFRLLSQPPTREIFWASFSVSNCQFLNWENMRHAFFGATMTQQQQTHANKNMKKIDGEFGLKQCLSLFVNYHP